MHNLYIHIERESMDWIHNLDVVRWIWLGRRSDIERTGIVKLSFQFLSLSWLTFSSSPWSHGWLNHKNGSGDVPRAILADQWPRPIWCLYIRQRCGMAPSLQLVGRSQPRPTVKKRGSEFDLLTVWLSATGWRMKRDQDYWGLRGGYHPGIRSKLVCGMWVQCLKGAATQHC